MGPPNGSTWVVGSCRVPEMSLAPGAMFRGGGPPQNSKLVRMETGRRTALALSSGTTL